MITMSTLGSNGRLGNQIMQYMAMIGLSRKAKQTIFMPVWNYEQYFSGPFPVNGTYNGSANYTKANEPHYHYSENFERLLTNKANFDVKGYFQSDKYWKHCEDEVKSIFKWKTSFKNELKDRYKHIFEKRTIAIHIRRGDYVGNKSYHNLHINYYIKALEIYFTQRDNYNIVIFSDDPSYCKRHFDCLDNAYVMEGNSDIEDMCLMSMCDNFILSNSSFSWCAAYLSETSGTVVRPVYHFAGNYAETHNAKDFWCEKWIAFDHYSPNKKINLTDVTFTIPFANDHQDRVENLMLTINFLKTHFETNIILGEQGKQTISLDCDYMLFEYPGLFHRTKMLNEMAKKATTPYIVNWDVDIIIAPLQILETVKKLRNGAGIVYPYGGTFNRVQRNPWREELLHMSCDVGCFRDMRFDSLISWGGAVFYNKQTFISAGMENENFISFGPEDAERRERFIKLKLNPIRQKGVLYHIEHYRGLNSGKTHKYINHNRAERNKVREMSEEQLKNYIKTWEWVKNY